MKTIIVIGLIIHSIFVLFAASAGGGIFSAHFHIYLSKKHSGRMAGNGAHGLYNLMKISRLKIIHIQHIGVPRFCLD
jgi:hypothetical protein